MTFDQVMSITSFAVTVGLGLVSILLAVFAIWLSRHFDNESSSALDAIKDLASEIRNLTRGVLSQQEGFSTKMLDSILSRSEYGSLQDNTEDGRESPVVSVIREQLLKTEERIKSSVERELKPFASTPGHDQDELERVLRSIQASITGLSSSAVEAVGETITLPNDLRVKLEGYRDYPAFYVLLGAIVRERPKTVKEIEDIEKKYSIPRHWEAGGLDRLLSDKILQGERERFELNEDFVGPLAVWYDRNWHVIRRLMREYSVKSADKVTETELEIARDLSFQPYGGNIPLAI